MKILNYISVCLILTSCAAIKNGNNVAYDGFKYDGILEKHSYKCSVPGVSAKNMYIYLPQTYYSSDKRYPVVYLLHGANGNELSWINKGKILQQIDSLAEIIRECIYVFPNMNHYDCDEDLCNSREVGSVSSYLRLDGSVEHSFADDVINYVDSCFRTIPDKHYRAIAGLSLGGLQTIYISSNNPDTFGYIGLFSPLIYPPFKFGKYGYIYNGLEKKLDKQFSSPPKIYTIMVGKGDVYFNSSYYYSKLLSDENHSHSFQISDGGHTWKNWSNYAAVFLKELWNN